MELNYPTGEDTPTKQCPRCKGKGYRYTRKALIESIGRFRKCPFCSGSGEVYLTSDEILFEQYCRKEDSCS